MKEKSPENISEFISRNKSPGHLRRSMRRHSAPLQEAFSAPESDAQWLIDQAGNSVDPEYAREMIQRFSNTCGEQPRMEASSGSWLLLSAFDEIMTRLIDSESEWDPYKLVCAKSEGLMLLRLLAQQRVISNKAETLAKISLSTYVRCWLGAIVRDNGGDKIIIEITPAGTDVSTDWFEKLN